MSRIPDTTTPQGLWRITGAQAPSAKALDGDIATEVAIVGGGFCGLSTALHLAEAGTEATVIEAEEIGWGASGRNGGQVIAGLKVEPAELVEKFGSQRGEELYRFGAQTAELVFSIIERFQIQCEAHRDGWIQAGHSSPMLVEIRDRVAQLQAHGDDVEWLAADRIQAMTGTTYYRGGMLDRRSGMVQPLSYARGLAAAAAASGARIIDRTRVTRLSREADGWILETPRGRVKAKKVLLATNGYLGDLYPALKTAMIIVQSYQIATDPLPPSLDKAILPCRLPVSDLMDLGVYYRRDDAGRFIVGGSGTITETEDPKLFAVLARSASILYPALRDIPFTSRWGGKLTLTPDHLPRVITLEPGLHAAYGCNGRGVALTTMMGKIAAGRLRGVDHPNLPVSTLPPAHYPFHGLRLPAMLVIRKFRRLRRMFARA